MTKTKTSKFESRAIGALVGILLGTNVANYVAAERAFDKVTSPELRAELAREIKNDYKSQGPIYKLTNFGGFLNANHEFVKSSLEYLH